MTTLFNERIDLTQIYEQGKHNSYIFIVISQIKTVYCILLIPVIRLCSGFGYLRFLDARTYNSLLCISVSKNTEKAVQIHLLYAVKPSLVQKSAELFIYLSYLHTSSFLSFTRVEVKTTKCKSITIKYYVNCETKHLQIKTNSKERSTVRF